MGFESSLEHSLELLSLLGLAVEVEGASCDGEG